MIARILSWPLRLVGIMPTPTDTSSYSSPYSQNVGLAVQSLGPDAERRRALAQRAVDARIAKLTNSQNIPVNNHDDESLLSSSAEIIPEASPASLTSAASRTTASYPVDDKT